MWSVKSPTSSSEEPLQQPSFRNYDAPYRTHQGPQNTNGRSVNRAPVCSVSMLIVSHTRMSSDLPGWRVTHDDSSSGTSPPNTELPPHRLHPLFQHPLFQSLSASFPSSAVFKPQFSSLHNGRKGPHFVLSEFF